MKNFVFKMLAATSLMLAHIGGAHAAVYVGAWDPLFGNPYSTPNALFFNITAQVTVPDSCVPGSGSGSVTVTTSSCLTGSSVDSALVTLKSGDQLVTYTTPPLDFTSGLTSISQLNFFNGLLTGLSTNTTGLALGSGLVTPFYPNDSFDLGFSGDPFLVAHHWQICEPEDDCWESFLQYCFVDYTAPNPGSDPYTTRGWELVSGGTVPEPASVTLVVAALIGMGWAGRRSPGSGRHRQ